MDYFLVICSVIIYVENRLTTDIDYVSLEKATGFSLAHIRDIFAQKTGKPLSKYILERKISNAAFEIIQQKLFEEVAALFWQVSGSFGKMAEVLGGWQRGENQMRNFAKPEIRKHIVKIIFETKDADEKALETLKRLVDVL